jgi:hypothetical protein
MLRHLRLLLGVRWKQALRQSGGRSSSLVLTAILIVVFVIPWSLLMAFSTWMALSAGGMPPESIHNLIRLGFSAFYLYSLFSPFFGVQTADYLDLEKARLFPLSPRVLYLASLIPGLFSAGLLFVGPTVLVVIIALSQSTAGILFHLFIIGLFLVHAALLRHAITLGCLNLLRRRRYQDILRILLPLAAVAGFVIFQAVLYGEPQEVSRILLRMRIPGPLQWTPPFWFSGLMFAEEEQPLVIILQAGLVLIFTLMLFMLGALLFQRALVSELDSVPSRAKGKKWEDQPARSSRRGWRALGPLGGIVAKELHILRREPAVKSLLIQQSFLFLLPIGAALARTGFDWEKASRMGSGVVTPTLLILLYVEFQVFYFALGFEGKGMMQLLSCPAEPRQILAGKNLVYGSLALMWNTGIILAFGFFFGYPQQAFGYTVLGVLALPLMLGWANLSSVLFPLPVASGRRGTLSQSGSERRGCLFAIWTYLNILILMIIASPVFFAFAMEGFNEGRAWPLHGVETVAAAGYSAMVYAGLTTLAARIFQRRQGRLVEVFTAVGA